MNICIYVLTVLSYFGSVQAADGTLTCRLGQIEDIPGILEQYENAEKNMDTDKIVVLPKAFREGSLVSSMQKQRLFVAAEGERVLGLKKLFLMSDLDEREEILADEIRCRESSVCAGMIVRNAVDLPTVLPNEAFDDNGIVIIYSGGSFTDPICRGKGINSELMKFALKRTECDIIESLLKPESTGLALAYGLAKPNAGEGILGGRTPGLLAAFNALINDLEVHAQLKEHGRSFSQEIILSRYAAFKPTFDSESAECKPLPDDQSIPGFGCIITCKLNK